MKQPRLSQFAPSTSHLFCPTRVFYIHTHPGGPSILASVIHKSEDKDKDNEPKSPKIDVFEITIQALSKSEIKDQILGTSEANFRPHEIVPLVSKLEHIAREVESPFLSISQGGWYKRFFQASRTERSEDQEDGTEEIIARLDGPLLDMGHWKLTFPTPTPTSPQSQTQTQPEGNDNKHEVELRPTGPGSNADVLVLNSVPFIWEMLHGREVFRLWRCSMSEGRLGSQVRREVGVYIARNHRDPGKEGVLVLDDAADEGIDAIVGIMTCLGTCNQTHSFRM
ncbi:hypothetical protein V8F20_003982 [Naviculisporaceae sp. PSN 640]